MNIRGKGTVLGASLVALGLWANVAGAGVAAVCPDAAKTGQGETSVFPNAKLTLTTDVGGVICWDYGLGNVQSAPKEYVDPAVYLPKVQDVDPYGTLQLPKFFIGGVWVNATQIGKIDSSSPLGNAYLSGDYTGTSGSLNINAVSPYGMVLTFHTGGRQNLNGNNTSGNNPTFYAFWLPANFSSDSIDWLLQRTDGSNSNGMSNVTLWAVNNDELTLVPIPAAAWLLGSGLLGLVAVGRRRRAAVATASA